MSAPLHPGAGQPPIVEFHGVGKTYPGAPAPSLQDIGLGISSGEVFGMIGRSGAGKSSLLRLVNRLESPTVGSVRVHGEDIGQLDAQRLRALRRRVGMIFQHFNLISVKTVWQNVAMPLLLAGLKGEAADARVREALQLVGLSDKLHAYPGQLSGGQKQRVGIARALVNKPDILLCDEATSALDPETTVSILELLREINRSLGLTIVLITHEMDVIRAICDRVLVLDQGRAAELGPVWQVFGNPRHAVTRGLLDRGDGQLPADLGHRLRPTRPGPADTEPEALLQLRFSGEGRHEPDLLALAHSLGTPARLRHARIERIQGRALGEWLISSPLAEAQIPPTLRRLGRHADTVELLGFLDEPGTPPPTRPLPRSAGAHA